DDDAAGFSRFPRSAPARERLPKPAVQSAGSAFGVEDGEPFRQAVLHQPVASGTQDRDRRDREDAYPFPTRERLAGKDAFPRSTLLARRRDRILRSAERDLYRIAGAG